MTNTPLQCTLSLNGDGMPVLTIADPTATEPMLRRIVAAWLELGSIVSEAVIVVMAAEFEPASDNVFMEHGCVWMPEKRYAALLQEIGMNTRSTRNLVTRSLTMTCREAWGSGGFPFNLSAIAAETRRPGFAGRFLGLNHTGEKMLATLRQFIAGLEKAHIIPLK